MSKPASKSISVNFSPEKKYQFGIDGRGTSVLGKLQGDHVTAYGLVEEGFYRILSNLSDEEVDGLFKLDNRESLRERRGKVYDYISSIAILDKKNAVSLYTQIDEILKEYNEKRHSKTELRQDTREAQENDTLNKKSLAQILRGIELQYRENGEFVRESLLKIVGLVMTFYNHIPNTSYFSIPEFEASSSEGSTVRTSTEAIASKIRSAQNLVKDGSIASNNRLTRLSDEAVDSIVNLIHLPEIIPVEYEDKKGKKITKSVDDFLEEHKNKTVIDGAKTAKARENTEQELVTALAKHMHITFAVYPELKEVFDKNYLTKSFVEKFIGGRNGNPNDMGWPTFRRQSERDRIYELVKDKLKDFKKMTKEKHYTSYEEYDDLVSSDDEEESTKPRPRIAKPKAKTLMKVKQEGIVIDEDTLRELEELRKFKQLVEKEGAISHSLKQKLKKECPSLYQGDGKTL